VRIRARILELKATCLQHNFVDDVDEELINPTDKRLFAIANAFDLGYSVEKIWEMTKIDKWFLTKLEHVFKMSSLLS
jgi:carbamoyl-phosphate synthase/aspartate carbamoyltransferase